MHASSNVRDIAHIPWPPRDDGHDQHQHGPPLATQCYLDPTLPYPYPYCYPYPAPYPFPYPQNYCYPYPHRMNPAPDTNVVTVVLTCHPAYFSALPAALASVDAQDSPPIAKLLVIDAPLSAALPISAEQLERTGWQVVRGHWVNPNLARNAALPKLSVGWVTYMDADNLMPEGYLRKMLAIARDVEPGTAVIYPDVVLVNREGKRGYVHAMPEWSLGAAQSRSVADTASFWWINALREVKGFDPLSKGHDDFNLSLRLFSAAWKGKHANVEITHTEHDCNRSREYALGDSLMTAYTFGIVTLWSGKSAAEDELLGWLERAELPARTALYWVDNSGGKLTAKLKAAYERIKHRFTALHFIDMGEPYYIAPGEPYIDIRRHSHVAGLYNQVFTRVREEMVVILEDDVIPPLDGIHQLMQHFRPGSNTAFVTGVYRSRTAPTHCCAATHKEQWSGVPRYDDLPSNAFEVSMSGGGFAIVGNWALQQALPMRCEYSKRGYLMGWDGNLGLALAAKGYKLILEPKTKCKHLCAEVIEYLSRNPEPFIQSEAEVVKIESTGLRVSETLFKGLKWVMAVAFNQAHSKPYLSYREHLIAAIKSWERFCGDRNVLNPCIVVEGDPAGLPIEARPFVVARANGLFSYNSGQWPPAQRSDRWEDAVAIGTLAKLEAMSISDHEDILFTDADVLFCKPWVTPDLSDGRIKAGPRMWPGDTGFNSGVMLIPKGSLREHWSAIRRLAKERRGKGDSGYDQSILQAALGDVDFFPEGFEARPFWSPKERPAIMHFHGPKLGQIRSLMQKQPEKPSGTAELFIKARLSYEDALAMLESHFRD